MELEPETCRKSYQRVFKGALDADTWGQSLEAIDEYERLCMAIERDLKSLDISSDDRSTLNKVRLSCSLRVETLRDMTGQKTFALEYIKRVGPVLNDIFRGTEIVFPVQLDHFTTALSENKIKTVTSGVQEVQPHDENKEDTRDHSTGTLLPALTVSHSGVTTFSITIVKIGLKDASTYISPFVEVSIRDPSGQAVGEIQQTPPSNELEDKHVIFDQVVHAQVSWDQFQDDWSVFFEFKHYKPKKKKISTRCFAIMDYDELQDARTNATKQLQLYKKPTDFTKKKLRLLSVKDYALLRVKLDFYKH